MVGEEDCLYLNVYVPRVSERRESRDKRRGRKEIEERENIKNSSSLSL